MSVEEDFEKWCNETGHSKFDGSVWSGYLAGRADERKRNLEIVKGTPLTIFHIDGQYAMKRRIADLIERQEGI